MFDFKFDLQLFGGGGGGKGGESQSTTSSYTPSAEEQQIIQYMSQNAETAQSGINSLLNQFNTGVQGSDFQNLLGNSSNLISSGQSLYSQLANGELPSAYTENMTNAIRTGVNNTVGSAVNSLGNRGVLNSSVTNKALNDIESNVADTMAQQYLNNINTLSNLAGNQISTATAGYTPYTTLTGLAQGLTDTYVNSPISALRSMGTTTSTQSSDSGGMNPLLGLGLGLASGWFG